MPRETAPSDAVPLLLAVALDGLGWHPAAWRLSPADGAAPFTARYWTELVTEAEAAGLDLVTIEDTLDVQSTRLDGPDGRADQVRGRLDATLVAARVAPLTHHIGLIPTASVTHTGPYHIAAAVTALDQLTGGRAGWRPRVSLRPAEARHFGRRHIPTLDPTRLEHPDDLRLFTDLFAETAEAARTVRQLWDGRQPVIAALAHAPIPYAFAAGNADVVFITPTDAGQASRIIADVRDAETATGRVGPPLLILADLVVVLGDTASSARARRSRLDDVDGAPFTSDAAIFTGDPGQLAGLLLEWHRAGVDGFRLRPAVLPDDLTAFTRSVVPILREKGLLRAGHPTGTLRDRLGLPRVAGPRAAPAPAATPATAASPASDTTPATAAAASRNVPTSAAVPPAAPASARVRSPMSGQVILAAHLPGPEIRAGYGGTAVDGPHGYAALAAAARAAERAGLDFLLLGPDLSAAGPAAGSTGAPGADLDDPDPGTGHPGVLTFLAALAAVTTRLGLVGALDVTRYEPYDLARQLATLDHLSDGRAGWCLTTTGTASGGAALLPGPGPELRYGHSAEFVRVLRQLWASWPVGAVVADRDSGRYVTTADPGAFTHHGAEFDVTGHFTVPRTPQLHPVLGLPAMSAEERELAASAGAELVFHPYGSATGETFRADLRDRLARHRRTPEEVRVLQAVTVVLGDTRARAQERAHRYRVDPAHSLVGTGQDVADRLAHLVRAGTADGFVLTGLDADGLDEFADRVVPLLRERNLLPAGRTGATLRDRLGLPTATGYRNHDGGQAGVAAQVDSGPATARVNGPTMTGSACGRSAVRPR